MQLPARASSGPADVATLQQQMKAIQTDINDVEQRLLLAKQRHKQISLDQQISGEPYTCMSLSPLGRYAYIDIVHCTI